MKTKLYLYGCALCTAVLMSVSGSVFSQCNCSPGVPATPVSSWASLYPNPTTATTSVLWFPKFDPSIGDLKCISIKGKITAVTQTYVRNTAETTEFSGFLTLTPRLTGPGTNVANTFIKTYGPDSLYSQHWIDSLGYGSSDITYGPDSLYKDYELTKNITTNFADFTTNLGSYVQFKYEINGGPNTTGGGSNFDFSISTISSGAFNLVYYWCPHAPLSSNIKNFAAKLNDNIVNITWQGQNQGAGNIFELQVSNDGQTFSTIYVQPSMITETAEGNYKYTYNAAQSGSSVLYFRIRQTDANGKETYTPVSKVTRELVNSKEMGIYPNPVLDKISLKFEKEIDGDLSVDIVNLTGQVVYNKVIRLNNTKTAQLDLHNPPSKGIYYVRATNQRSGVIYVNKLFMQ